MPWVRTVRTARETAQVEDRKGNPGWSSGLGEILTIFKPVLSVFFGLHGFLPFEGLWIHREVLIRR